MKVKTKLLLGAAMMAIAAWGGIMAASASSPPCGPAEMSTDSFGIRIKKVAYCSGFKEWTWGIHKSADQSSLTLSEGQQFPVNYEVQVIGTLNESYTVTGEITVRNTSSETVTITGVNDSLGDVDCRVTFPYMLPPDTAFGCTYSGTSDVQAQENTATVTYGVSGTNSVTTALDWSGVTIPETDECVSVSDDLGGALGTVCRGSQTFSYPVTIGPYAECGSYEVSNTASFVTNDTATGDSSTWVVDVEVPCQTGCTLTPGYWKTHSSFGPAPYDDTWATIGEGTTFFHSGQSYYGVLWTNPSGGNAYYILANAYIAAELNNLNGADFSAAQSAFDAATALFDDPSNTPESIGSLKGHARDAWLSLATTLDSYNNGLIGPGHCSE